MKNKPSTSRKTIAYTDGATWLTNPGPAGVGVVFMGHDPNPWETTLCIPLDVTTNNVAEYRGVIEAIEHWFLQIPGDELEIRSDSQLVVEQVNSRWRTKSEHLRPLQARVKALQRLAKRAGARVTLVYIPREQNTLADKISKEAALLAANTVA